MLGSGITSSASSRHAGAIYFRPNPSLEAPVRNLFCFPSLGWQDRAPQRIRQRMFDITSTPIRHDFSQTRHYFDISPLLSREKTHLTMLDMIDAQTRLHEFTPNSGQRIPRAREPQVLAEILVCGISGCLWTHLLGSYRGLELSYATRHAQPDPLSSPRALPRDRR